MAVNRNKKNGNSSLSSAKKSTTSKPVVVRISKGSGHSPHIMDLRDKNTDLGGVPVFKEKKSSQKRVELDLPALIREANRKSEKKVYPASPSFLRPTLRGEKKIPLPKPPHRSTFATPSFIPPPSFVLAEDSVEEVEEKPEKQSRKSRRLSFLFEFDWRGMSLQVVALVLLLVLPFPAFAYYKEVKQNTSKVVDQTTTAFLSLQASTVAALQANIPQAEADLNVALASFAGAEEILQKEHKVIQYVAGLIPVVGSQVQSREYILQAGHHLALGNTYLVQGLHVASEDKDKDLMSKIAIVQLHLKSALPQYQEALALLNRVEPKALPVEHQQSFEDFKLLFAAFIDDMGDLNSLSNSIQTIFGGTDFRRYLVVFQNNHELRATGGFAGSLAIVDVQKGKIMNIDVPGGGPYDLKGQFGLYLKPPSPVLLTNGRFEFQDSNWWPDFPSSAQKMSEFYENSRHTSLDGVIAINASVLEKILSVLGPVQNDEHAVTLSAENVLTTLQKKVEKDYDKEANTPKAIIGDVVKDLRAQLGTLDASKALQLLSDVDASLEEKDIQIYMRDAKVEKDMKDFGWSGEIITSSSTQDYLMVVQSNLQGQKSDAKMDQTIEHQATVQEDGSVIDTVIIRRKHNGEKGEEFYGAANISYVRAYVPEGATLLDAGGFQYPPEEAFHSPEKWYTDDAEVKNLEKELGIESKSGTHIFEGFGKTIFGNWMITMPGETSESYFVYKLPFSVVSKEEYTKNQNWTGKLLGSSLKETSAYYLLAQGQSGIKSDFTSSVIYPDSWKPSWVSTHDNMTLASNGAEFKTTLQKQLVQGIVMERKSK